MPDMSKIMFVRPNRCDDCSPEATCDTCIQGYNALAHVEAHAQSQGWQVFDVAGDQANKTDVYTAIDQHDPGVFYFFGHGDDGRYTAQHRENIFTTAECDKVNGRMVYLLSCLTANQLGPAMMQKGAVAYAGFNISWTWIAETDGDNNFIYVDPYDDKYAKCFYESANELTVALSNGASFLEAVQASIQKYNEWIDYWYNENPSDPSSQDCIMWLAADRDGLVALTYCDYLQTEQECQAAGCLWDGNSCHSTAQHRAGFNPVILIPIIFLVGLVFIATRK